MRYKTFSYRFAEELLNNPQYSIAKTEIKYIVEHAPLIKREVPKRRKSGKEFITDQNALNKYFKKEFLARGWEVNPLITDNGVTNIKADFKKNTIQIEVQFGNMARWYADVFKFQVSYSLNLIDVGVLIVPTNKFAKTIGENVVNYERVIRELPYAKMSITLPIWVLGIEPEEL